METKARPQPGRASRRERPMKTPLCLTIATALCGLPLSLPAPAAVAQGPSVQGYDEVGISTLPPAEGIPSSPDDRATLDTPGDLPQEGRGRLAFTGLGLPLPALVGGLLVACGALIRRSLVPGACDGGRSGACGG